VSDEDTTASSYTSRLTTLSGADWKQRLDVQAPYRWNLRRLLGGRRVLDVGCGIGRNLAGLEAGSVGVDHNPHSVEHCRSMGLRAYMTEEFHDADLGTFDGLLLAHVVEHLAPGAEADVLREYLPYVNPGSSVVLICPQERGFATDSTHTTFFDFAGLRDVCMRAALPVEKAYSFPFPRIMGKVFPYNEFVVVALRS
jgi:2-polyprenyl-3-methyl-5-hydroxy-6-metoxy-1,4-benzoquinol methylase